CEPLGMSKKAQRRDTPEGASGSSTTRARLLVPFGTPDHVNRGEISAPSQVYCEGISPPGGIAGLASNRAWPSPPTCPGATLQIDKNPFHAGDNLMTKTGSSSPRPLPSPLQHGNDF